MKSFITLALTALLSSVASAANANACAKDPYKALLPLSKYPPAESFCSSKYPQPAVTTTVTVTAGAHKRSQGTTTGNAAPTTQAKPTTTACTGACSTWTSCASKGGNWLSTLCSCIETPKTVTVTSTKTTTTSSSTTTSASPTFTCPNRQTGPDRCNCYYDNFCGQKYNGPVNATTTVSSYEACATFAGNIRTGNVQPADLNYFPGTGRCEALINPPNQVADANAIAGAAVYNSENCFYHDIQDLNHNGCGCDYAEDCDQYYEGEVYNSFTAGLADCQTACDYAGSNCIGFTNNGGYSCKLYKTITNKVNTFGSTSYHQVSCANPCTKS